MGRRLPEADFFLPGWLKSGREKRALLSAARSAPRILHLTHGQCLDGIGCDAMYRMKWGDEVATHFLHPAAVADALSAMADVPGEDRTLALSDLSWSVHRQAEILDALRSLRGGGWHVEWRDHHHKQWEGVDEATLRRHLDVVEVDRDLAECGASLVQKDLLPRDAFAKRLAAVVRDRDLWRNDDPLSEKLEFAAARLGSRLMVHRLVEERDLDASWIEETWRDVVRENELRTEDAIASARIERRAGWTVGLIYGRIPKNVTLHALREERGTDMEVSLKPDAELSVRSRKGADVAHLVGQAFGGGGHPNAAGGKLRVSAAGLLSLWAKGASHSSADRILDECFRQLATLGAPTPTQKKAGRARRRPRTAATANAVDAKPRRTAKGATGSGTRTAGKRTKVRPPSKGRKGKAGSTERPG